MATFLLVVEILRWHATAERAVLGVILVPIMAAALRSLRGFVPVPASASARLEVDQS